MPKSRGVFNHQIKVNLAHAAHAELGIFAQRQGLRLGETARAIIERFFTEKEEREEGRVVQSPVEDKALKESVVKLSGRVEELVLLMKAENLTLDELALSFFLHTPEIPVASQGKAFESGSRRHREFQGRVNARMSKKEHR